MRRCLQRAHSAWGLFAPARVVAQMQRRLPSRTRTQSEQRPTSPPVRAVFAVSFRSSILPGFHLSFLLVPVDRAVCATRSLVDCEPQRRFAHLSVRKTRVAYGKSPSSLAGSASMNRATKLNEGRE